MTTAETLAFWALIISAATLLTYLGQLIVLILVYRRVIKETDRNAEIRTQEIAKAGDTLQEMGRETKRQLNKIALRNVLGMGIMGLCLIVMIFSNRTIIRKDERNTTQKPGR